MLEINKNESKTKVASLLRIGIYSLLVNLLLVATKLVFSIVAGSIALRADSIHSLVDVFSSIALILGIFISNRKNNNFPYGLYKVENVVAVIISLLLFLTAYEIIREAIMSVPAPVAYSSWVLWAVAALILVPFFFGRYEQSMGKMLNSPSLIADGSQFKADVLTSSVVFFAVLAQRFGLPLDRIAAGVIAIFILRAGWCLLSNSMRVLLDASIDQDTLEQIRLVVEREPTVSTIESVTGRNSGRYVFVEAIVTLRIVDLERAYLVSRQIEEKIRGVVPNVDRVLIHYKPQDKTHLRYAVALSNSREEINLQFGGAPFFALIDVDLEERKLLRQEIVANPLTDVTKRRGIEVAELLLNHKPDIVVTRENLSGKGPGYAFTDAGVDTMQTESMLLSEFLEYVLADLNDRR